MQYTDRKPTADEQAGMDWWNGQPERLRTCWLKKAEASEPSAAGPWQAFKAAAEACEQWAKKGPVRVHSGLEFLGFEFSVRVYPGDDGRLGVQVIAEPPSTGFKDGCSMGSEGAGRLRFGINAKIGATTLGWLAQDEHVPLYWEGLRLVQQPHQYEQLRAWLPRLGRAAVPAQSLATALRRRLGEDVPTLHYMSDFTSNLAARTVLDDEEPAVAIASEMREHWAAKEPGVQAAVAAPEIAALMETARFAREEEAAA